MKKLILVLVMTIGFTITSNNKVHAQSFWKTFIHWIIPDKKRRGENIPT